MTPLKPRGLVVVKLGAQLFQELESVFANALAGILWQMFVVDVVCQRAFSGRVNG